MPRTATLVGKTHKGDWKLLSHPGVPLQEQLKKFRSVLGSKSHPEFSYMQIQESDGHERHVHLLTPEKGKAHDDLRAKEHNESIEAGKKEEANKKNAQKLIDQERADRHAADIRAIEAMDKGVKPPAAGETEESEPGEPAKKVNGLFNAEGLRLDGPTLAQFIEAGYSKDKYPPAGYAVREEPKPETEKPPTETKSPEATAKPS